MNEKDKTYSIFGVMQIINDLDLDYHMWDNDVIFIFDDRNERHADVKKIGENEYAFGEWKPYRYANSIGV